MRIRFALLLPGLAFATLFIGYGIASQTTLPLKVVAFPWTQVVRPLSRIFSPVSDACLCTCCLLQWTLIGAAIDAFVRRPRAGRCPVCSYDLRGTPGLYCSECGALTRKRIIAAAAPAVLEERDSNG